MNLSGIWSWLKPFLVDGITQANAALVALKPAVLAEVAQLATKDAPSIIAVLESKVTFGGIFGSEIKALVFGYIASELPKLTSELGAADGAWFDELIALLEAEEQRIGL
jgi:hypothetical protein